MAGSRGGIRLDCADPSVAPVLTPGPPSSLLHLAAARRATEGNGIRNGGTVRNGSVLANRSAKAGLIPSGFALAPERRNGSLLLLNRRRVREGDRTTAGEVPIGVRVVCENSRRWPKDCLKAVERVARRGPRSPRIREKPALSLTSSLAICNPPVNDGSFDEIPAWNRLCLPPARC